MPDSACPTYRALYHGLEEFERDLHHHVHLENNILFPRALHMEQGVVGDSQMNTINLDHRGPGRCGQA